MQFLLIVGSSYSEDRVPLKTRVRNNNMRLQWTHVKTAILGPTGAAVSTLYFKILNMLEKLSVHTLKGRFWRRIKAFFCNSGWAATVARSMISVQEHEKHMKSSSFGFQ